MPRSKQTYGDNYERKTGRASSVSPKKETGKKYGSDWVDYYPTDDQKEAIKMLSEDAENFWAALQVAAEQGITIKLTPALDGSPAKAMLYAEAVKWQNRTTIIVQHYQLRQVLATAAYLVSTDLAVIGANGNLELVERPDFNW